MEVITNELYDTKFFSRDTAKIITSYLELLECYPKYYYFDGKYTNIRRYYSSTGYCFELLKKKKYNSESKETGLDQIYTKADQLYLSKYYEVKDNILDGQFISYYNTTITNECVIFKDSYPDNLYIKYSNKIHKNNIQKIALYEDGLKNGYSITLSYKKDTNSDIITNTEISYYENGEKMSSDKTSDKGSAYITEKAMYNIMYEEEILVPVYPFSIKIDKFINEHSNKIQNHLHEYFFKDYYNIIYEEAIKYPDNIHYEEIVTDIVQMIKDFKMSGNTRERILFKIKYKRIKIQFPLLYHKIIQHSSIEEISELIYYIREVCKGNLIASEANFIIKSLNSNNTLDLIGHKTIYYIV